MSWHTTTFAQRAETASKIMACAALFSIVLPTAFISVFLALFLICSIVAGNYKFKFRLIVNNSVALLAAAIFLLFVISVVYTSGSVEDVQALLIKYRKFIYIPLLLSAFYEQRWKRIGYIAFLSGVTLMLLMSYMTLLGWSPESIYSGSYGQDGSHYSPHIVFMSSIAHGTLMAYAAYLYFHLALDTDNKIVRIFFIVLTALASFNVLFMISSRTGQLVWVALMLLLIYQHLGWKRMVLGFVIIPVLAATVVAFSDQNRSYWARLQSNMEFVEQGDYSSSLGLRLLWTRAGWDTFKDNPILGAGVGSFKNEFRKRLEAKMVVNSEWHIHQSGHNPHNEYISVSVQLGLVGFVFLIALFIRQWQVSNHLPLFSNYAAKGMILTVVVSSFMNSTIYSHNQGLFFALFTALLFSSYTPNRSLGDIR